jgi:hypothetical protein
VSQRASYLRALVVLGPAGAPRHLAEGLVMLELGPGRLFTSA